MDKYGISTQVFNTYVADFHGTTVTLFQKESPDAPTNKPVCFDCHGVHDIARVDDPQKGLELRQNILKRCQVCHPNATTNFSEAWMSHYIPSPTKYPVVYFVDLFYKFFIPGVLGSMAILVVLDVSSVVRQKRRKSKAPPKPPAVEPPAQASSVAKSPAVETPVAEPPADETPTAQPVAESPTGETPTAQPAAEPPADETPTAQPPTAPADETSTDKPVSGENKESSHD